MSVENADNRSPAHGLNDDVRVQCNSLYAKRFRLYQEGDIYDVPGINDLLAQSEDDGSGSIVQEACAIAVNSRQGLFIAAPLRSKGVNYMDIIQAGNHVASQRPMFLNGALSPAAPYRNGKIVTDKTTQGPLNVAFGFKGKILSGIASDRGALERYFKGSAKWENPTLSVFKANDFEAAQRVADDLNEAVDGKKVPIKLGALMVFYSITRNVRLDLATELHADIKPGC